jgi:hypothetical protein
MQTLKDLTGVVCDVCRFYSGDTSAIQKSIEHILETGHTVALCFADKTILCLSQEEKVKGESL